MSMTETRLRLDGEVGIVTGAGNGLGRAYAFALAERGASVICNDVVAAAAEATAKEIAHRGGSAVAETTSVAAPEGGATIVRRAIDAFGSLQIVINNAGQLRNAAFEDMSVEDFDDVIRTHLAGSFYVTQPAYRHMQAAGYGRIIFTSSNVGAFGLPWQANYAAAKAGLLGLCNVVALEGAAHGIRANSILPQALNTSMQNPAGRAAYAPQDLEEMAEVMAPVARYMRVENVAPLVVYLASRACNLTGEAFSVGCGRVARVFVGVSPGWFAPDPRGATPEDIAAHLDKARDLTSFGVLRSGFDEFRFMAEHMPEHRKQAISSGTDPA
jgi:NAD(P)-dependent dehydrogenase (short-subunit alcohol dehydrogenase family)